MSIDELILNLVLCPGVIGLISLLSMAFTSFRENEKRAAGVLFLISFLISAPFLVVGLIQFKGQTSAGVVLLFLTFLVIAAFLLPLGKVKYKENDIPKSQIDERDIMFSRNLLQPGTDRFESYYRSNPEKKALDEKFREKPGLMQPGSAFFDPVSFAATEASFKTVAALQPLLDLQPGDKKALKIHPYKMTTFLKEWTKKLGAISVGITELKDHHKYSTIGRGPRYGEPVRLDHRYAIALTVEMDKTMLDHAPYGPTAMESAQQYVNAGNIAVQLAEFIKEIGYPARAHIDGNYRVVCPLVARDAGLGEVGRMGLLMTPELGPRVRLAVVTTDIPLVTDHRERDHTVIDFCNRCTKCAVNCPGKAIPFGERIEIEGVKRWRIDSEACFTYWCTAGTDCGRCMRVCPYSHPNNMMHNLVRKGIKNSVLFRIAAVKMDDLLYGRNPKPNPVPEWIHSVTASEE
ncbi:4Fe-4S dicluster domain-containing protein [Chloroflexota bacterium]